MQINREREAETRTPILRKKFNNKLVKQLILELSDRQLEKFIVNFKNQFDNFELFILESSLDKDLKQDILLSCSKILSRDLKLDSCPQ